MSSVDVGCKVNWTLRVLGRRSDGFHELRSWFVALRGGDYLSWREGETGLEVDGPCSRGVPLDASNLVLRADRLWRQAGGVAPDLKWSLRKELPAGSGLGAGSADAAAVLRVLQAVSSRALSEPDLLRVAAELGSDVPFFCLEDDAVLLGGRGERVLARSTTPCPYVVVILPQVHASTPEIFRALQAPQWEESNLADELADTCPERPDGNDLQAAALQALPQLESLETELITFAQFQLSGSGSAWFSACDCAEAAAELCDRLHASGIQARVMRAGRPRGLDVEELA